MAIIDVTTYGAQGVGDDTVAILAANAAAKAGDILYFPKRYGMSQTLIPNCALMGADKINSGLFVFPGSSLPTLVNAGGLPTFSARNMRFTGENVYVSKSQGAAIEFGGGGSNGATNGVVIEGCWFDNWKADYTILGYANQQTARTRICRNDFVNNDGIGTSQGGTLVALFGTANAPFVHTSFDENFIDGTNVAIGCIAYDNHDGFSARGNIIENMGLNSTVPNCYALAAYGNDASTNSPINVLFEGNVIKNAASAGIYVASCVRVHSTSNNISGQYRTDNQTLLRGAIIYNGVQGGSIASNDLSENFVGIGLSGMSTTTSLFDVLVSSNRIRSAVAGSTIGIQADCSFAINQRIDILNNSIWIFSGGGTAIMNSITGNGDVVIAGNSWRATSAGFIATANNTTYIGGNISIS